MKKYFKKITIRYFYLFLLSLLMLFADSIKATTLYSIANGDWSDQLTWSNNSNGTSCGCTPLTTDDVIIERGYTVTVSILTSIQTVTFSGTGASAILLINNDLFVHSGIVINSNAASAATISVNADLQVPTINLKSIAGANRACSISGTGGLICDSILVGSNVTPSANTTTTLTTNLSSISLYRISIYSSTNVSITNNSTFKLENGTLTVNESIIPMADSGSTSSFSMNTGSASGILNLTDSLPFKTVQNAGAFNVALNGSNSIVNYLGSGPQKVLGTTYKTLKINRSNSSGDGAYLIGTISLTNLIIGDSNPSTYFYEDGHQISVIGSGMLNCVAGTYWLGGSTQTVFPSFNSITCSSGSGIGYANFGSGTQLVSGAPTYSNLFFAGGGNFSLSGHNVNCDTFSIDTGKIDLGNYTINGTGLFKLKKTATLALQGSFPSGFTSYIIDTGTTIKYNGTNQQVVPLYYGNLIIDGSVGTKSLAVGSSSIDGNLKVLSSTLDLSSNLLNQISPGGDTLFIADGGTLKIGGTSSFPSGYTVNLLGATSTVEYNGAMDQDVYQNVDYGNLKLSNGFTKQLTSNSLPFIINGNLFIDSSTTFDNSINDTINLSGNWVNNNGIYYAGSTVVIFNGSSSTHTIKSDGSHFYDLTHAGNDTLKLLDNLYIDNNLLNDTGIFDANSFDCHIGNILNITGGTYYPGSGLDTIGQGLSVSSYGRFSSSLNSKVYVGSPNGLAINPTSIFTAPGNQGEFWVYDSFHASDGTFYHNNGTVTLISNNTPFDFSPGNSNYFNVVDSTSILDSLQTSISINGNFSKTTQSFFDSKNNNVIVNGLTTITGGGTYSAGNGTHSFNGGLSVLNGSFQGGSANVNATNVTIDTQGSLISSSSFDFNISGNWSDSSVASFTNNGGTINFNGSTGLQNIFTLDTNPFYNIIHSGQSTLQLNSSIKISNYFTNDSGTFNLNGKQCSIGGDWTNNSIFTSNHGKVTFNGSMGNMQIIDGADSSNFGALIIDNSFGVNLMRSSQISDSLILRSGVVTIDSGQSIKVVNTNPNAISNNTNPPSYVDGPLVWKLNQGSKYKFPVGDGLLYLPFELYDSVGTSMVLRVQAFNANSTGTPNTSGLALLDTTQYWSAKLDSGSFSQGRISLTRTTPINPGSRVANCQSVNGVYQPLSGSSTADSTVSNAKTTSLKYFMIGENCNAPTISLDSNTITVCQGVLIDSLTYSVTTNNPNSYSIDYYDTAAQNNHFVNVDSASLITNKINITIDSTVHAGSYNANLTIETSSGCLSQNYPITIKVNAIPVMSSTDSLDICSGSQVNLHLTNDSNYLATYVWYAQQTLPAGISIQNGPLSPDSFITDILIDSTTHTVPLKYSVIPTITNSGCVGDTQEVSVIVYPKPYMTSSSFFSICSGAEVNDTLRSNISSRFFWSALSNNSISGAHTGIDSTSLFIRDTLLNVSDSIDNSITYQVIPHSTLALSCIGNTQQVQVTVHPKPILTPIVSDKDTVLCSGSKTHITLTSTVPAISTFSWTAFQTGNNLSGFSSCNTVSACGDTITDLLFNLSNTTPYNVTYYLVPWANTCRGDTDTLNIKVKPASVPPVGTISGSMNAISLCPGSKNISFELNPVIGGEQYIWYSDSLTLFNNDSLSSTGIIDTTGHTVISIPAGYLSSTATIILKDSNIFNCSSINTFNINISSANQAPPIAKINPKQPGNLLVYLDNSVEEYQWGYDSIADGSSHLITDQVYQVFIPESRFIDSNKLDTNNYWFWVLVQDGGCMTKAYYNGPYRVLKVAHPIPTSYEVKINIVPNPTNGEFNAVINGNIYGRLETKIFDAFGKEVYSGLIEKDTDSFTQPIKTDNLPAGIYMLRINDSNLQSVVVKIIIR
jgi:hypothetical protein